MDTRTVVSRLLTRIAPSATAIAALSLFPADGRGQTAEIQVDRPVFAFLSELVGHRCEIRAAWPNGQPFRLDKEFEWALDGRIVTVNSFVVDEEGGRSPRNHGIRAYPQDAEDARFWEFDRLGNVTEGPVWVDGETLYYEYPYGGETLRDSWSPAGDDAYAFKVRRWENGEWGPTYLDGTYHCRRIAGADG